MDFLPPDRRLFRPLASLGEALRTAARSRWPHHTAKEAARAWDLDPSTADNLAKGIGSARTVVKAVRAEGPDAWSLWDALGELIIGESRDEYDERVLALILQETALARQRLEDRKARRAALEARTYGLPAMDHRPRS